MKVTVPVGVPASRSGNAYRGREHHRLPEHGRKFSDEVTTALVVSLFTTCVMAADVTPLKHYRRRRRPPWMEWDCN